MRLILFISISIILFSCKKAEDRTCWKSAGDETKLEVSLESFDKLFLREHIVYELVQDSLNKLVITGGENLVKHIKYSVTDGLLEIKNDNRCNFFRSYKKKIKVEIHFTDIFNIHFEGTEPLTNVDTLKFNYLTFLIRDGSGSVNLKFNSIVIFTTISHGYGDFTFSGKTNYANFNVRSNGYCDAYGLEVADSLVAINNSQGDIKINANGSILKAETDLDGNIYYKGVPSSIKFNQYGKGELIDAN